MPIYRVSDDSYNAVIAAPTPERACELFTEQVAGEGKGVEAHPMSDAEELTLRLDVKKTAAEWSREFDEVVLNHDVW